MPSARCFKGRFLIVATFPLVTTGAAGVELTDTELRWLKAGWPVIAYAKRTDLPVDIVVQPQSRAGDAPLAMGYEAGRCKLVLSMRGNPHAEATLAPIEPALLPAVVEAMFAHELGHCWRYVQGKWHAWPAGFRDAPEATGDPTLAEERRSMRDTRREEGFADLAGLAWTATRHRTQYGQVHAWLDAFRADQPVEGAHHDTRVWVRLARSPRAFSGEGTPFDQAEAVWRKGLLDAEGRQ